MRNAAERVILSPMSGGVLPTIQYLLCVGDSDFAAHEFREEGIAEVF